MKVKELIEQLRGFDQELDVYVCDEAEGNDTDLDRIEIGNSGYDACDPNSKTRTVLMLRWG